MSHLQYYAYEGQGERALEKYSYNQAVRVGDRIECSGQGKAPRFLLTSPEHQLSNYKGISGGWNNQTGKFETEINAQIDLAFANVERCLLDAGGAGWSQVYRVNSYHVPINDEALAAMIRNFRKYMPNHKPIWTTIGVSRLGEDDMRVEIEVVAHVPSASESAQA
ncbi:Endoribonuclease L-PSP/chorismate mutase-like protein [Moelleriella libera RCEF 2490]|uniref:Endoribonuclease L-PSP/chorismate mutase-like protein n=1 Tax=Moelleriella libera RCEF 2490 TaxID=1081109 RepID=A0A167Z551_9HYPO|nr:Endoribonuclease L-PSP/chorismate mutase-like protein [Moelleriella libera RCEF 2490]